jgi:hypothetical protein
MLSKNCHYLLGNTFIFFVGHQAFLHLVNKPIVTNWIAKWLLLLQEFDFRGIYKLSHVHFVPDHLFRITHGKLAIGVEYCLLGNAFIFFVNHQALLHLVNKPVVTSWIAKWLLLLQEFNFRVIYKLRRVHFVLNHLSQITHGKLATGVEDQLPDIGLFTVDMDWYAQVRKYLEQGYFEEDIPNGVCKRITIKAMPYTLKEGILYKLGPAGVSH